jgi:hypothetical protein
MSTPARILMVEGDTTPTPPTAGQVLLYAKTNDTFYSLNSSGIETPLGGGGGTVTSVAATGLQGVSISGSPITGSGTLSIGLGNITPTSVAATGTVTGSNLSGSSSGINTGDQTITLTGDVTGSGTGTFAATLSNTGVLANTYGSSTQVPVFTVDAKGRITSVTNTNITSGSGTVTSVAATGTTDITVGGSPITTSGTLTFALSDTGVAANTYGSATQVPVFTVDAKGRITSVTNTNITGGSNEPEIVVFRYSSGGSGSFIGGDNIYSQTPGVTATITDAANCIATYSFTGKSNPPKSITIYAQNYTTNDFTITDTTSLPSANRKIAGGGTSASPDIANGIFSASNIVTLQTRMSDTGASAGIGQRAHLVVVFGF